MFLGVQFKSARLGNPKAAAHAVIMLVAYLVKVPVASAILPISILHLPQAVDCGGDLVNVWGLSCLCRINVAVRPLVLDSVKPDNNKYFRLKKENPALLEED